MQGVQRRDHRVVSESKYHGWNICIITYDVRCTNNSRKPFRIYDALGHKSVDAIMVTRVSSSKINIRVTQLVTFTKRTGTYSKTDQQRTLIWNQCLLQSHLFTVYLTHISKWRLTNHLKIVLTDCILQLPQTLVNIERLDCQ